MSGDNEHWSLKLVDNAGWVALACMALTGIFYAGLVDKGVHIDNRPEAFASADSDAPEILGPYELIVLEEEGPWPGDTAIVSGDRADAVTKQPRAADQVRIRLGPAHLAMRDARKV